MRSFRFASIGIFFAILVFQLLSPSPAHLQGPNLAIKEINPVVNEGNQIQLTAVNSAGQPLSDVSFESGSPEIAQVDPRTGVVRGMQRGFATVTARRGSDSISTFVVVTRLTSGNVGMKVPGDVKVDTSGAIYVSDPLSNIILKNGALFAGQRGAGGKIDGQGTNARFAGPTAVTVDNRAQGGIYIADTLNHSIRKIDFLGNVTTVLGVGSPGINLNDSTPFANAKFNSPQGVSADTGGNLFIADTDNHAIYIADFQKGEVRLFAGNPGTSGKANGQGKAALFSRPTAITVQQPSSKFFGNGDQGGVYVADTGNNRIRFITFDGKVTTLGRIPQIPNQLEANITVEQSDDEFSFDGPSSISVDALGNVYVVDKSGPKVIIRSSNGMRSMVSLAQPGSFGNASSVVTNGNNTLVLDSNAPSDAQAVTVVTVGGPEIVSMSKDFDRLEGGSDIVVMGRNFAPESLVVLGDSVVDASIESATRISFTVPPQNAPGRRTLSILTRGGVAQREFRINSKRLDEIFDGEITTIAGGVPFLGDNGNASASSFKFPQSVAVDGTGNILIADTTNNRIRRIDAAGIVTTIAGTGSGNFSGDGGPAISAGLNNPRGIALDSAGNIFITDAGNNRIRRVDAGTGIITTAAGNGSAGFSGDGGQAVNASLALSLAGGIAIDSAGNLFIPDMDNNRIRRVDARTGIITTVAGSSQPGFGGDGGPAVNARLLFPTAVAVDTAGNLYIADAANNRIRRVDAQTRIISTFAGNGSDVFNGDNRPAASAAINLPFNVIVDRAGNVIIADTFNSRIRRVDAQSKIITTLAGNGSDVFGGDGGPAGGAGLGNPVGIAVDGAGNLIIADQLNNRIRRVSLDGIIRTIAGTNPIIGDGGAAIDAGLSNPFAVAFDSTGNLIIADSENQRIRRVDMTTGVITTIAGNGFDGFGGDGGPALNASFSLPTSIALDSADNIFVADAGNHRIRRIDARSGIITTAAGTGEQGFGGDGGPATRALLSLPIGVAIDSSGNLIIADTFNFRIRRVDRNSGVITTIAGTGTLGFSGDGGPARNARVSLPFFLAADQSGNIFISDSGGVFSINGNYRIRRISSNGTITTVAGNGQTGFSGDGGQATAAALGNPFAIALDGMGNLLIGDIDTQRIRRVDAATGIIRTVVGNGAANYSGDGDSALAASLNSPKGMAVDKAGNLFIAGGFNDAIRVVKGFSKIVPGGDFRLDVSPAVQNVSAGSTAAFTINLQSLGSFNQSVNLTASVNPSNGAITTSLSQSAITPGGNATLTVSAGASAPTGQFAVTVAGTSGLITRSRTVILNVTAPSTMITGALFNKPNLFINGSGFGSSGARVIVNGLDVSAKLTAQNDSQITLKGNKKKLGLKKGTNQVTVTVNGVASNTFSFTL